MSRSIRTLALSAAVLLLAAPAARAQDLSASALTPVPAAQVAVPVLSSVVAVPAAAHRATQLDAATQAAVAAQAGVAAQQRAGRGDGKVYMIVGGVAFLAGAVIDGSAGDIVMISGAVVGLYGLYLYLR